MIKDIREINFPEYATLDQATVTINDMGDRSISTQVKIDGSVVPDFSYDWEVEFKGERYIHPVRKPQGTKDNASMSAKIDMVFHHWAIYEMKRHYFVEMSSTTAGTAIADKYIASLGLNLGDFITAFNLVLNHYFGDRIVAKLNPGWQYDAEVQFVSISYSYVWDVLQQIHDIYGVRWTLKTNADGVCEILMGYPAEEVSHIFEYGFEGGLLSVQRQVQSTEIRNRLLGRGGEKNLPLRYFKDKDPHNPLFSGDPDWVPELANIAFTELRGKTFRDYVKGWKAKHYNGTAMDEPTEAYLAGYNAEKFGPMEYVEDKESIAKYGVLIGALENNEEIYPSIQGAPGDVDKIIDAEQVVDDDVDASVEEDSVVTNLASWYQVYRNAPANSVVTIETLTTSKFNVPEGKIGNLDLSLSVKGEKYYGYSYQETYPILRSNTVEITIYDRDTNEEVMKSSGIPVVNIPAGKYYYKVKADVETNYDQPSSITLNIESVHLYVSTPESPSGWKNTFDIWVRNIWGSSRNSGETDQQYADRVWAPILGDRTGGEARVVFASGWLSFSSDWEFPIVRYAYDDTKEGSHWRLTLGKSDAELEASGKYIPYKGYNASAGDRFFFIGIDMPYKYVLWAEERLDDFKRDSLLKTSDINPTWVIKTDKVRLNEDREGSTLIDAINVGSQIRLASKQFISGAYENLYIQSVTYKWGMDTIIHPDVEIVVSDKVYAVKNPVAQMQSSIDTIQRQVGSLSNIQQIIRQVCDTLYLRKDGISDVSKSPTKFLGKITGEKFQQGQIGGKDWAIYRDGQGNAILETDKIIVRQGLFINDLAINEATYVGGLQINSAASMDVTQVEENTEGYVCFFDEKQGTVYNKFKVDDVVLCQRFDSEDNETKFYKAQVIARNESSVTLSKANFNGTDIPTEGDVIIQYGNYTDKDRQFVIIRDVIGGGYEKMIMGLDSIESSGTEYYFAGKSQDGKARWFVGDPEQYVKYEDGRLQVSAVLNILPGTTGVENLEGISEAIQNSVGGLEFGKFNLLRNSGFSGDFVTESLDDTTFLDEDDEMFSDPFTHWTASNASVHNSEVGQSGKEVVLSNGMLSQTLKDKIIAGENYVLSFRAKGQSLSYSIGGVSGSETLSAEWQKYIIKFKSESAASVFSINATATICDLQLERGTVQSAWGHSMYDNQSELAMYQAMDYLKSAIKDGSSTVLGGLILSNLIMLGNPGRQDNTAGVSGIYNNDDDVAFWGGGTWVQAIATAMRYAEDPYYTPTDEELTTLAKYVVTHGGKAILTDAIIRGMIIAKSGKISGFNIEDDWLRAAGEGYETTISPARISTRATSKELPNGTFTSLANMQAYPGAGISSIVHARVEMVPSREFPEERAIAVYASAKGANKAKYDPTVLGDYLGEYGGNYAFYSPDGMFAGLRPKCVVLSDGQTYRCSHVDHTLISNSEVGITNKIYLPEDPQDGQVIKVWKNNGHILVIATTDGRNIVRMNIGTQASWGIDSAFFGTIDLLYHSTLGVWLMIIHETY